MATTSRTLTAKFDGDTTGLASAAKRGEKIVKDFGDKAGRGMGAEFEKGFDSGGKRGFLRAATAGAGAFAETLTTGFRNLKGPAIAALIAGVVVAMPAVGALAASGLVFAFGAGLIGLGLAVTKNSPKVQAAFDKLLKPIGPKLKEIAKPFEDTWVAIIEGARKTFDKFEPALSKAFAALAPITSEFSGHFFDAMEKLEPVIQPIVDAFASIAKSLGPALPGIVSGIATAITKVAEAVEENPDALTDFFEGLGQIVEDALVLVTALTEMNTAIEDLTGGVSGIDIVFGLISGTIGGLTLAVKGVTGFIKLLKKAWDEVKGIFSKKHTADIEADDSGFRKVLRSVSLAAGAWDKASFWSTLTTTASPFYTVLRKAYESAGGWVKSTFKSTISALNKVWEVLQGAYRMGNEWAGKVFKATFTGIVSPLPGISSILPGRAAGGPVSAGRSYLVGERGPEVVTFGSSGRVTPNHELGGPTILEAHIEIGGEVVRVVRTEMKAKDRSTVRAVRAGALRGAPA